MFFVPLLAPPPDPQKTMPRTPDRFYLVLCDMLTLNGCSFDKDKKIQQNGMLIFNLTGIYILFCRRQTKIF